MKKLILFLFISSLCAISSFAQNDAKAREILNKTANTLTRKGGASAKFTLSGPKVSTSGTIAIKGNKFYAQTKETTVWYNDKTQWTYMKSTDEVNITTPTQAQRQMINPYTFINMYKSGYKLGLTANKQNYVIHMTALNKNKAIKELFITINKSTYAPSNIKMQYQSSWSTITINNFQEKKQADNIFVFNPKKYPSAEIIDLR